MEEKNKIRGNEQMDCSPNSGMLMTVKTIMFKILQLQFVRFCIVGAIATLIHYVIYYLLCQIIDTNIAYTIGYLISFFCNFALSAKFTFRAEATPRRGAGFALSHMVNYGLQMLVLNIGLKIGIPEVLAPIPVYVICIPLNFLLVKFVFKKI